MVIPLIAAGLAGLGISAGANLYSQYNSRKLYRKSRDAYAQLGEGYKKYLASHGRSVNSARYWDRYGQKVYGNDVNIANSYAGSIGTVGGTFGAGAMMSHKWL